jgi:pilus assembly protein Flp/PilA
MDTLSRLLRAFDADQSGATAIEYGLIAALIVVVIIATVNDISTATIAMYGLIVSAMT